uniref:Uncharacterized protein n=1 Tax=Quercus lobata TaxID=97700 RepID=A0A7N2MAJ6_QUELO
MKMLASSCGNISWSKTFASPYRMFDDVHLKGFTAFDLFRFPTYGVSLPVISTSNLLPNRRSCYLSSQIEEVRRTRALQHAARKRHGGSDGQGLATVAVIGYTNASFNCNPIWNSKHPNNHDLHQLWKKDAVIGAVPMSEIKAAAAAK